MKKGNRENHYHWVCFSDVATPQGQGSVEEWALEGRVQRVGPLSKIKSIRVFAKSGKPKRNESIKCVCFIVGVGY